MRLVASVLDVPVLTDNPALPPVPMSPAVTGDDELAMFGKP